MAHTGSQPAHGAAGATLAGRDPARLAFSLLRTTYTVAPILFGVDKFFNWMVDWDLYLWSGFANFFPGTPDQIMYGVGVIEIVAGLVVLLAPLVGGALVAAWLSGIVINLILVGVFQGEGEYWDIALRDFGLMMGAVALTILAMKYTPLGRRLSSGPRANASCRCSTTLNSTSTSHDPSRANSRPEMMPNSCNADEQLARCRAPSAAPDRTRSRPAAPFVRSATPFVQAPFPGLTGASTVRRDRA